MSEETSVAIKEEDEKMLATQSEVPMGFEDEEAGDMIIPRVKLIQTLSPERKEGSAVEGDIINSLTKDKLNGRTFVPVFKFSNHIEWKPRAEGGGIKCIARDGKHGEMIDGRQLICASCKRCEFDNTKQGKEALPQCTKYINFLGFFAGERLPIILSFGKTSYNEGKKLYSLAKVTMKNMWHYGYTLAAKLNSKNGNEWFTPSMAPAGVTSEEDMAFAASLYKTYRDTIQNVRYDMEDTASDIDSNPDVDASKSEF